MKAKRLFLFFFFYGTIGIAYSQISYDSIVHYTKQIQKTDNVEALSRGLIFFDKNMDAIAELYKENPQATANYYYSFAIGLYNLGFYDDSEARATEVLKLLDAKEDSKSQDLRIAAYCHLGILQNHYSRYNLAEEQYLKALDIAVNAKDSIYVINNLGNNFKDQNNNLEAIKWLELGLELVPGLTKDRESQRTKLLGNLGSALYKIDSEQGRKKLEEAIEIAHQLEDPKRIYSISRHLLRYYLFKQDTVQATMFAHKTLLIADQISDVSYKKESLRFLVELEAATAKQAALYARLAESLDEAEKNAANKYSLQKFDKTKAENDAMRTDKRNQVLVLALILLVFSFIGVYMIIYSRSKQKQTQAIFITEQRIASEIHDGVANDIFQTMSKIQSKEYSKDEILGDLDVIYSDTRNISKANQGLETDQDFEKLLGSLLGSFQSEDLKVISKDLKSLDWSNLKHNKREALYKVLRELLVNTCKHSNASVVVVSFERLRNRYVIGYKDNGKGAELIPKGGLRHAESRIAAVQGRITFESSPNSGVMVLIEL